MTKPEKLKEITLDELKKMRESGDTREAFMLQKIQGYDYISNVFEAVTYFVEDKESV